nr:hypothetical protein CPGR_05600 [Mycolicibacter nonchromogenicus]
MVNELSSDCITSTMIECAEALRGNKLCSIIAGWRAMVSISRAKRQGPPSIRWVPIIDNRLDPLP